jgi:DNA-damage-inducible protein D
MNTPYKRGRKLQNELNYKEWRNFKNVILKAIKVCNSEKKDAPTHFEKTTVSVPIANGAHRKVDDFLLSPYACTLIKRLAKTH